MLNMTKKAVSVLLIFILSATLSSCRYETRVDFSELIRRMNNVNDTYEGDVRSSFYYNGEWFLFTDTASEKDILITGKEDSDKKLLSVSVSAVNNKNEEQKEIFSDFCKAAVRAFTENYDSEKIIEDSGICNTEALFTEGAYFSENERFTTSLYTTETGCSFIISIKTYGDDST